MINFHSTRAGPLLTVQAFLLGCLRIGRRTGLFEHEGLFLGLLEQLFFLGLQTGGWQTGELLLTLHDGEDFGAGLLLLPPKSPEAESCSTSIFAHAVFPSLSPLPAPSLPLLSFPDRRPFTA